MFFLSRHFVYRSICKMVSREARGYLRSRKTHFEPKRSPRKMTPRFIKDALGARVQETDWRSNKKEEQGKKKKKCGVQLWNSNKVLNKCRGGFEVGKMDEREFSSRKLQSAPSFFAMLNFVSWCKKCPLILSLGLYVCIKRSRKFSTKNTDARCDKLYGHSSFIPEYTGAFVFLYPSWNRRMPFRVTSFVRVSCIRIF